MENLYFNLDSIASWYGENVLTAVIQIDERFEDLESSLTRDVPLNDFEKAQVIDRLNKISELSFKIQHELALQRQKVIKMQQDLSPVVLPETQS